jgi:hypothetical protein
VADDILILHENKNSARMNKLMKLDTATGITQSTGITVLNIQLAMITAIIPIVNFRTRKSTGEPDLVRIRSKNGVQ